MCRSSLKFVSRLLIATLLFLQMAVAAYACPQLAAEQVVMADCAAMKQLDRDNPNLCAEHARFGEQASHAGELPAVPAFAQDGFFTPVPVAQEADALLFSIPAAAILAPPSGPPHAILHCCLRS